MAALAAAALCLAVAGASVQASAAVPGLVAAYGFGEGAGASTADVSGLGNTGALAGPAWTAAGKFGSALTFDGVNDWVTVADAPPLDLTTGLTLSAWVRPTVTSGSRAVMFKEHGATFAYALYSSSGGRPMATIVTSGTQKKATGPSALPANTWTHLAMTYSGTRLLLFVNGVQSASKSTTGSMPNSTGPLRIGGTAVFTSQWLAGSLDELRVYNRALTAAELQADMGVPVGPSDAEPPATPPNLRQTGAAVTSATVAWDPSGDNVGTTGYRLFRGPQETGTTTATTHTFTGLACGSTESVGVEAYDAAGNVSPRAVLDVTAAACDTTPPSVSIGEPSGGAVVSGWIDVAAAAADESGVAGVQFFVDGAAIGPEDPTAPYSVEWNTIPAGNGARALSAVARDTSNNTTTSAEVQVTVDNDTTPPSVQLTAPDDGATVTGVIQLAASASDDRGVAGVRFRLDGVDLGAEDTTAPYTLDWDSSQVTSGAHSIAAVARDGGDNLTTSVGRSIFVTNGLNTDDAWKKVTVGPGYVDASTRTPVRTAGGWVYLFAADDTARGNGVGPVVIRAWKANQPGIPTAFSEQDGANRPTANLGTTHVLGSPDVRLDRNGVAHLVYMNQSSDTLNYRTFSTVTNTWGPNEVVETGIGMDFDGNTSYRRETTNSLVLDANEVPHVVYKSGSSLVHRHRTGGTWSAAEVVDTPPAGTPRHSSLAADALGNLHAAWLRSDWLVVPDDHPTIMYRRRDAAGVWLPPEVVADTDVLSNEDSDQGPSIVVTQNGVPHVLYVSAKPDSAVQTKHRFGGAWVASNPPIDVFTHAPQIYAQYNDIYAFLGHDDDIHFGYVFQLSGQPWEPYDQLDSTGDNDGSGSPRYDQLRETNPEVIDVSFYEENFFNDSRRIPELYYMAVLPSGGPTDENPPTPPTDLAQTGATENSVSFSWTGSTDDVGVAGYGLYRNSSPAGSTAAPSATLTGVQCGTGITVGVDAFDGAGNRSPQATLAAQAAPCDTVFPTVSVTNPAGGSSVGGTVPVEATALDNTGVVGVQFRVDGANLGLEDTSPPYLVDWNTGTVPNGAHALTAVARDLSGNASLSDAVTVTVDNTGPPIPPSLVAGYALNEASGNTAQDVSGNGNHGTLSGPTRTAGRFGGGLTFDGVNDWVTVPDSPSLDLTTGATLEAWVRPTVASGWRTAILKEQPGSLVYALYSSATSGRPMGIVYTLGAQQKLSGDASLPLNTWSHLALTYDGQTMRLYVNGTQRASKTQTGAMPSSSGVLRFGGNDVWRTEWLKGDLDEIRIYNRALSEAEIQADMQTGL